MRGKIIYILATIFFIPIFSCEYNSNTKKTITSLSPQQLIQANIDSIKINSRPGDLLVRLNEDMISEIIKQLSDSDKSFSHAGIVIEKNNQKLVCHILPDDTNNGADTVKYEPIDSFIDPKKNLYCGWYRYGISAAEINILTAQLDAFHQKNAHFDKHFDLKTDNELYCSEMIAKAMQKATHNKFIFSSTYIPENMIKVMMVYFGKFHPTYAQIKKTPFISIQNLYTIPGCKEMLRTKLKIMP